MNFQREWIVLIHNMGQTYGKAVLKSRGIPIYLFICLRKAPMKAKVPWVEKLDVKPKRWLSK